MSEIGKPQESFHRLEEFPTYISCILSFGKPIIPPLITPDRALELRQLRVAAINKESQIVRRTKERLREIKDDPTLSMFETGGKPVFQSRVQASCALWYPSYLDNKDVSVAISKFPTNGIYSSVHTDAIVCSNVVGSNHAYDSNIIKDGLVDSEVNECSHSDINLECSLCIAEWNQNPCNKSFPSNLSPEVPHRTYSLLKHSVMEGESNTTECESLRCDGICNQKNAQMDTDSESNTTCITQSTDLEKYMELSHEFSSPDNSTVAWDSKMANQQCTLSRSDDASSETIVNTENELTPCASTMAELTDNIEDEFSNAEEVPCASDSKEPRGVMKRAHSVDSYMKNFQKCEKYLNVKKSQSEPFSSNIVTHSIDINDNTTITSKNNLLIKEDSKESDEAKDVPEKDNCVEENLVYDRAPEPEVKHQSSRKRHVRQNTYILEHPSSALVIAHADCSCNCDVDCVSPHSSVLKDVDEVKCNSAFVKGKVAISTSHPQMKTFSILNPERPSNDVNVDNEEMSSAVVDIFPNINEHTCEKSDSRNSKILMNTDISDVKGDLKMHAESYLTEKLLENLNLSNQEKHQECLKSIHEEFISRYEKRVKELREEQARQLSSLEKEYKEQEMLLYENFKTTLKSSKGLPYKNEDLKKNNLNCCNIDKMSEDKSSFQNELPTSHSSESSLSDQIHDSSSSTQTSTLSIPNKYSSASLSPLEIHANSRISSPFKESDRNPPIAFENIEVRQLLKDTDVSVACLKDNESAVYTTCESMPNVNGFSHPSLFVPHVNSPPKYPSAIAVPIYNDCDKIATCFCDNTFELCRCCVSFNGHSEYDVNSPYPCSMSSREQNPLPPGSNTSSLAFKTLPSYSEIQNTSAESVDFNGSKMNLTKIPCYSIPTAKKDYPISLENGELSHAKKIDRDESSRSVKENSKLVVDNLVSLYGKTSANGTCVPHNTTLKDKMNADPNLKMQLFEKLPAFVKGYLTRCLLKTRHVQQLIRTFKDTVSLLGKMSEIAEKGDSISQRDVDFHRQLIVLLMTTYDKFYDTFFTISTKERMNIIAESRLSKLRKLANQEKGPSPTVTSRIPESASNKTPKLSSATYEVLERKKRPSIDSRTYSVEDLRKNRSRSVLDMRTYTIDDLPTFRGRAQSSMSCKGVNVDASFKQKTPNSKSCGSRGSVQQKPWVP